MSKKKITLLGDSIRLIGYGVVLPKLLGEEYEVWQPEDNCRFAQYCLRLIFDEAANIDGSDIITFNSGLWDMNDLFGDGPFTPMDIYLGEIERMANILKKKCRRLIFVTTTPVRNENPHHDNERIREYNEAVKEKLLPLGVEICDLYPVISADIERYIRADDMIHLTKEGIEAAAHKLAKFITEEKFSHIIQI